MDNIPQNVYFVPREKVFNMPYEQYCFSECFCSLLPVYVEAFLKQPKTRVESVVCDFKKKWRKIIPIGNGIKEYN